MARLGWPEGHGARLRKERRKFAREEASALVKASMAELERRELGETRRVERGEVGATRRVGMEEAGLGERLGREQEFARPLQAAETGRVGALAGLRGAEAEKVRYGTEFQKGARGDIEDILEAKATEARLGITEEERRIELRDEAEAVAAEAATEAEAAREVPPEPAIPGRRLRPSIKRHLLLGRPDIGIRGPLAPLKESYDIFKLLKKGLGESYEYAFPRGR